MIRAVLFPKAAAIALCAVLAAILLSYTFGFYGPGDGLPMCPMLFPRMPLSSPASAVVDEKQRRGETHEEDRACTGTGGPKSLCQPLSGRCRIQGKNLPALGRKAFLWSGYPDLNWGPHPYQVIASLGSTAV